MELKIKWHFSKFCLVVFLCSFHKSLTNRVHAIICEKIREHLNNTFALEFYVPNTTFSGSPC